MNAAVGIAIAAGTTGLALAWHRRRRRRLLAFSEAHVLADLLRRPERSSVELLEIFLERVSRIDCRLNAVVVKDVERARARAALADRALELGVVWGPLHGLPMTVKEEMAVAGLPRCLGDPAEAGRVDRESCEAVQRLQAAGAIVFGKTNVPAGCVDWQTYNAVCAPPSAADSPSPPPPPRATLRRNSGCRPRPQRGLSRAPPPRATDGTTRNPWRLSRWRTDVSAGGS